MKVDVVSDVFEFILRNGELTESVLFSDEEITELKPEERAAIEAVSGHVKESYVGLLLACREALLREAGSWINRSTLERNKSRPDTVWKNACIHVPLLIRKSWEAWVTFALWNTSEPGRPIKLFADVRAQRKHFSLLSKLAQERALDLRVAESSCRLGRVLPKQGETFVKIAEDLAKDAWPIAQTLHQRILGESGK